MQISGFLCVFAVGTLGGVAVEVLRWWKIAQGGSWPEYGKSPLFWLLTIAMCLLGGLLAAFHGIDSQKAMAAFNFGATAPLIIGALSQKKDSSAPNPTGFSPSGPRMANGDVRSFLSFRG